MDKPLTLWINHTLAHPWADALFNGLSSKWGFGLPLALGICIFLGWRYRWDGAKLALFLVTALVIGDGVGGIIKLASPQLRPCSEIYTELRRPPGATGPCETYHSGMPSNHALNFFLLFMFVTWVWRSRLWGSVLFILAVAVATSRVYLGMHYPSQVLVGAGIGLATGAAAALVALRFSRAVRAIHRRQGVGNA
ncbi:MAG: phosphatase PAP2 family protein [Gammaproteobacteria bacterium]|nr:phosphatase PAP2 family protein [Gammaproteobacteria bacterium]